MRDFCHCERPAARRTTAYVVESGTWVTWTLGAVAAGVLAVRFFRAKVECTADEFRFAGVFRSRAYARQHGVTSIVPIRRFGATFSAITVVGRKRPIVLPMVLQPHGDEDRRALHERVGDWLADRRA